VNQARFECAHCVAILLMVWLPAVRLGVHDAELFELLGDIGLAFLGRGG
jgi:hypothetical protein